MLLSSDVALFGGNSTTHGSGYYALIKAVLSLLHGNVHPHTVLPFVVEHAGGINKEGMQFFRMCRDAADMYNKLNTRASDLSSWSSKGFSIVFLKSLSLANLKGLGHLFMVTAASIRAA